MRTSVNSVTLTGKEGGAWEKKVSTEAAGSESSSCNLGVFAPFGRKERKTNLPWTVSAPRAWGSHGLFSFAAPLNTARGRGPSLQDPATWLGFLPAGPCCPSLTLALTGVLVWPHGQDSRQSCVSHPDRKGQPVSASRPTDTRLHHRNLMLFGLQTQ